MKVECDNISIQIDINEFEKLKSEFDKLKYSDDRFYKLYPTIFELFDSIKTVSNNKNHIIDKKL